MRIYEFDNSKLKTRVKNAIDKLDDSDPRQQRVLVHVKNTIFDSVLQSVLASSGLQAKIGNQPFDWFKNILEVSKVPLEDKVHFVKLLSDPSNLMTDGVLKQNSEGSVLSFLSSKITSNNAFKATSEQIWNYKIGGQGGMGPAELFFIMFARDARKVSSKEGGDVAIGDWKVELKREGSVSPGSSSHRVVDRLNKDLLDVAVKEGFIDEVFPGYSGGIPPTSLNGGWLPAFFDAYAKLHGKSASKSKFAEYLGLLYGDESSAYVDRVFDELGSPTAERALAPMILSMYKKNHAWDSICFVGEGFRMVNLVTFDNLPPSMTTSIKLKRGGDTQAVADGYMNVGLATPKARAQRPEKGSQPPKNRSDGNAGAKPQNLEKKPNPNEPSPAQSDVAEPNGARVPEVDTLAPVEPNSEDTQSQEVTETLLRRLVSLAMYNR
jgi:hypothetical protein